MEKAMFSSKKLTFDNFVKAKGNSIYSTVHVNVAFLVFQYKTVVSKTCRKNEKNIFDLFHLIAVVVLFSRRSVGLRRPVVVVRIHWGLAGTPVRAVFV